MDSEQVAPRGARQETSASKALLLGLEEPAATDLASILGAQGYAVDQRALRTGGDYIGLLAMLQPDVVFCAADSGTYRTLIEQARAAMPGLPIIVFGRSAEVQDWLDALDAGAWDYCAPPVEPRTIGWVLPKSFASHTTK